MRTRSIALITALVLGCSGGSTSGGSGGGGGTASLTVSPKTVTTVAGGPVVPLTASLTGSSDPIAWTYSPQVGTLSATAGSSVSYTPPASVSTQTSVTVTATAGTLTATVTITVKPAGGGSVISLSVAPVVATVSAGGDPVSFTATLTGSSDPIQWSDSPAIGSLSTTTGSTVSYTPPATVAAQTMVTLTATAGRASSSVTVIVLPAGSGNLSLSVSPTSAAVPAGGAATRFTATVSGSSDPIQWSYSPTVGALSAGTGAVVDYTPPASVTTQTIVTLTATAGTASASVQVIVSPASSGSTFTVAGASPGTITAGSAATTVTITGTGFTAATTVNWSTTALPTSFVSATTLTVQVPATALATPGVLLLLVQDPVGGAAGAQIMVNATGGGGGGGGATVIWFNPTKLTAGTQGATLYLFGTGFTSSTVVTLGSTPVTATLVDANDLTVQVPASLLASATSYSVSVSNSPGSSSTAATQLQVSATGPFVTGASPAAGLVGLPLLDVTLTGTGFVPGTLVTWTNGSSTTQFITRYVDSTHVVVTLLQAQLSAATTWTFTVVNPDGVSTLTTFPVVAPPAPTVTSVTPGAVPALSSSATVALSGAGFVPSTTVSLDGTSLGTHYVDQNTLTAGVPGSALTTQRVLDLVVTTPAPGGGIAHGSLTVGRPVPAVTGIAPAKVVYGTNGVTAIVAGANFDPSATVSWNSTPLTTTFVDSGTLQVVVPAAALATAGSPAQLTVTNPPPAGGSAQTSITVTAAPVLASISAAEAHVGAQLTLSGTDFGSPGTGGAVTVNGKAATIVSWSDTSVVVTVPSGATVTGNVVLNAGAATTAGKPFTVTATFSGRLVDGSPTASLNGAWGTTPTGQARFTVTPVEAPGRAVVASPTAWNAFPQNFSIELPLGSYTVTVTETDEQGGATIDLLRAASRQPRAITVGESGLTQDLDVLWHWDVHALDPGFNVCGFEKQIAFSDAQNGYVSFQVNAATDPASPDTQHIHGMVMKTTDGGQNWSMAGRDVSVGSDDFRPNDSGWFPYGYLLAYPGGGPILSMDWNGQVARSTNAGASWQLGALPWQKIGPGNPGFSRFARAGTGDTIYVGSSSGGVQGSYPLENLLVSYDKGATWSVKFAYCEGGYGTVCANQQPGGSFGQAMACSDVDDQHCITVGNFDWAKSTLLVTRDGFATTSTIAPVCGLFYLPRIYWVPGTLTAYVESDFVGVNPAGTYPCGPTRQFIVTHDGGATWTQWASSPFPGNSAFADSATAVSWWDWGVRIARDAQDPTHATWLYTGHPPGANAALKSVHVLDKDHVWVLGQPDCRSGGAAYVARWLP